MQILRNLTPKRLYIKGRDGALLVLAPLERDRRPEADLLERINYETLVSQNLIAVSDEEEQWYEKIARALPGIVTFAFFGFLVGNAVTAKNATYHFWFWIISLAVVAITALVGVFALWRGVNVVWRFAEQMLSLLLILSLGIALPALAIYYFGGGRELLAARPSLALLGRLLQLLFIVTASLLPALLYFLFDRQQLATLRNRFEHQIFRLDPHVETVMDVQAKYGEQIAEVYGPVLGKEEGRLIRGTRWPIIVATLVITMGWLLTLLPFDANLVINQPAEILNLFFPRPTAVVFGFLGAYFFTLNVSLLRYARADLKPKAYSSITVRLFLVVILAWVISALPLSNSNPVKLTFIFLVGIFPESGLTLIREYIRRQTGFFSKIIPYPKEWHPLTKLEGIDVYDRARLADEGVTNIEGLAHHDLIDLMLETRIPTPRLVDWLDQAILYLHLSTDNESDEQQDVKNAGTDKGLALRRCLREYGIRTASDLMKVHSGLSEILQEKDKESWNRIEMVWSALEDDEWFDHIKHWRLNGGIENKTYNVPKPIAPQSPPVDPNTHYEAQSMPPSQPS